MRHVKAVPLSRRNLKEFIDRLSATKPQQWPKFLYRAWAIVAIELKTPDVARETVMDAVRAAHACAVAYSSRTQTNEQNRVSGEVLSAVLKILKPIERRAPIRRALDEMARREFREGHVDLDAIASFFNGCADVVRRFKEAPDSRRMMAALGVPVEPVETDDKLAEPRTLNLINYYINYYEALHLADREAVEESLRKLLRDPSANLTAWDVFSTIARALTVGTITKANENGGDLLIAYVTEVEKLWRRSGFRPSRASNPDKPDYRSRYHTFLELILVDQLDPTSRLFNPIPEREMKRARKAHASIPPDVGIGRECSWLISEDYLKTAK